MTAIVRDLKSLGQLTAGRRPYRRDVQAVAPHCEHCKQPARLTTGEEIYPHRRDLAHKRFWKCDPCAAYVGCHPPKDSERGGQGDGTVPLGTPANHSLRNLRKHAHALFDPLFRDPGGMTRRDAYAWLRAPERLDLPASEAHIGHFGAEQCLRVIEIMDEHWQTRPIAEQRRAYG